MAATNDITGDSIKTTWNSEEYKSNYDKLFSDKPVDRGSYKQCRKTGKMIPIQEWYKLYGEQKKGTAPIIFVNKFDPYISPVSGEIINNKKEHKYDLESHGCRVYEGREQEEKEAQKYRNEQNLKLEAKVNTTIEKTSYEIDVGLRKPKENNQQQILQCEIGN